MIEAVSSYEIEKTVDFLSNFFWTRQANSYGAVMAGEYLVSRFNKTGLVGMLHNFDGNHNISSSAYAIFHGKEENNIVVVCGHYDDRQYDVLDPKSRAPGADDNAGGAAMVLEAARVIVKSGLKFQYSIHFISTSKEESYLNGAYAYADLLKSNNVNVVAMLNADMISYLPQGQFLQVAMIATEATDWLMQLSLNITTIYLPNIPRGYSNGCCDDHMAFVERGLPGISFFERINHVYSDNPYYHTINDSLGLSANNILETTIITKAIVASIAVIANPLNSSNSNLSH